MTSQPTAAQLDTHITRLADLRARTLPAHPATPPASPDKLHRMDNLLWHVRPAQDAPLLELAFYHAGLGWLSVLMSRGQLEDLQTSIAFALNDMQIRYNPSATPPGENTP
jgi:hypothetical protein